MAMKIHGHDHSLEICLGYVDCDACDDRSLSYDAVYCDDCGFTVHGKCAFVFSTPETLEHPAHVGHGLKLLTKGAPDHTDPKCHICGKNTKCLLYHCSVCNLNVDIGCMVDGMCAQANLIVPWHHHSLLKFYFGHGMRCNICGLADEHGYFCPRCKLMVHDKCVTVVEASEITHPLHARHSLKLLTQGAPGYTDPECHVCGEDTGRMFLYHCAVCKFNLDMVCAVDHHHRHKRAAITLSNMKVHDEHTLTLIPRMISFVCDACETKGDRSPYACLRCDHLMFFHQDCAVLPRVINVNRHDHRVSYKYPLGLGEWVCEICLEEIDWSYGAYSCSLCPNYALHSKCATREDVWDGKVLDGVPEEVEDIAPFKSNEDGTITHFAHEHNMGLNEDGIAVEESVLCRACVGPIGSYKFYNCSVCSFILHETCANLPKKKRHFLSPKPLTLVSINEDSKPMPCDACRQMCCTGFMYNDGNMFFDLICSSITMPSIHSSHQHPLLFLSVNFADQRTCPSCGMDAHGIVLGCNKCEKASGMYWCDICERETSPEEWFYTCSRDCGVTLHVFCVLGNVRYAKPGGRIDQGVDLMFNNTYTRPFCDHCHYRCIAPFFLIRDHKQLFCSYHCLRNSNKEASETGRSVICPPWLST